MAASVLRNWHAHNEKENNVDECLQRNMLKNNIEKLVLLNAHAPSTRKKFQPSSLTFGSITINSSKTVRNLGVTFDENLTLERHIAETSRKAFHQLRCISRIRNVIDEGTCNMLVCALVFPYIDYCNSLLYGVSKSVLHRLQRVQNSAARLVLRRPRSRFESTKPLRKALHWLPVSERICYKIAVLTFKCLNGLAPAYLAELVALHKPSRDLRSGHQHLMEVPRPRLERYGGRSFAAAAPLIWNALPLNVRAVSSLSEFVSSKRICSDVHILSLCNCSPIFMGAPSAPWTSYGKARYKYIIIIIWRLLFGTSSNALQVKHTCLHLCNNTTTY